MHETFDHTADLGLRIQAPNLNELFNEAAQALFAAIVENPDTVQPKQSSEIQLTESDREYLLFDWLKTLLFHFDADRLLFCRFDAEVSESALKATVWGEPWDAEKHELAHEVKAITYHDLRVEQTEDGWLAEVIVDI